MQTNMVQTGAPRADFFARLGSAAQPGGDGVLWQTAGYERLSREDGDKEESDSIANQKELIRAFAESRPDIELVSDYEDDGYSGVDYDRPDFKRMLEDIKSKKVNCVIVKEFPRL